MRAIAGLIALALGALAACASIDDDRRLPRAPDVSLVRLSLEEHGRSTDVATARLAFANPNAWRIAVEIVVVEITLNGTLLGRASAGRDVFIAGGRTREVEIEVVFAADPAIASLRRRQPPRGVGYVVEGEAKLVGRGVDLLPFRLEGRWPPR